MFGIVTALKKNGVLAINRRNADFILKYNPRKHFPLVDDKILTKEFAKDIGLAVPELYAIVEAEWQVHDLPRILENRPDFVLKPAHGSGGEGILVISGRSKEKLWEADGSILTWEEIFHHVFSILSGLYSLGGQPDRALIEYRVEFDPLFEPISYRGVPDIRIIVFLGVPVMAMVRLPTRMSGGKANLHQGAIGVGIDIATGKTLTAVWGNEIVEEHPDTGNPVKGITIPNWLTLLAIATKCYEFTGLGYQGVDIVLDKKLGPLILELNARPGLNIQIANNAGLLHRLRMVEEERSKLRNVQERLAFARRRFAAEEKWY